jgi:hypothetical protein
MEERQGYAFPLGSLLGNFHTLKFLLRAFLQDLLGATALGLPYGGLNLVKPELLVA